MNKFSIVIPTMWRYTPFCDFVQSLVDMEIIGEVIIINNDMELTPDHTVLKHHKVQLCNQQANIGVNPAWNLGVIGSKYTNICLMNDDVVFDLAVFYRVANILSQGKLLVIDVKRFDDTTVNTGRIKIDPIATTENLFHFGSLMFMSKTDWIPIPNGLRIFYGDNWIWETMRRRFEQTYAISELLFYTPGSVTCNLFVNKQNILDMETEEYGRLFSEYLSTLSK